ncbi:MAG: EF-P lysine aminoacylase GenX [Desulfobacteraceae bacterium]|nr:EF-P lysine aminoacylase GenX [Desulfobacteraceae bacterium]
MKNPKDRLTRRARVIQALRTFFFQNNYLEVETPIRIPAPAPEAHIDSFESENWYLQSSPELAMKRLMARGHERIFQICKCFRKEERGDRHLTELTMLEWYTAGHTYRNLMEQCALLVRHVARETGSGDSLTYRGETIDLASLPQILTVEEAFSRYTGTTLEQAVADQSFDERMAFEIEPRLGRGKPTCIIDYPAPMAALSRLKPEDPRFSERFEFYIAGMELANGFSELNDPAEQKKRFEAEAGLRASAGKPATPMPEPFLNDLGSMPDTAGIALGVDRLVMLFTDAHSIDDVVAFTPEAL